MYDLEYPGEIPVPKDILEPSGVAWKSNHEYYTDIFFYDLTDCTNGIIVMRCHRTNCDNLDYEIQLGTPQAEIDGSRDEGFRNWKACTAYTNLGYKVCKSLESQGFYLEDDR